MFPRKPVTNPIRPDTKSFASQSFHTLTRESAFLHPPTNKSDIPALDELVAPHIESFNALLEDSEGGGKGLLALAVDDIGAKVVFDGKKPGTGNRLSSESSLASRLSPIHATANAVEELTLISCCYLCLVRISDVTVGRPLVPDKDKTSKERRVFPSEVSSSSFPFSPQAAGSAGPPSSTSPS